MSLGKAAAVFLMKNGKILAVSRKNDPKDLGLPGGKVKQGESFEQAAIRELEEETGIVTKSLRPIFYRADKEFLCVTYIADKWMGEAEAKEPKTVVAWVDPEIITKGSFGEYNLNLLKHLKIIK